MCVFLSRYVARKWRNIDSKRYVFPIDQSISFDVDIDNFEESTLLLIVISNQRLPVLEF